jgi:uncharacterized membrane protein YeiH
MGTVTMVAGGAIRDILLAQDPVTLRADFYAIAAVIGCVAILLVRSASASMPVVSAAGGSGLFLRPHAGRAQPLASAGHPLTTKPP